MKYLQILAFDELKFNLPLFQMLHNSQLGFDSTEQTFVTPHIKVYEELSKYYHDIILLNENIINFINKHGGGYNYIFIHALSVSIVDIIRLKNKYARKIIWRFWGHDLSKLSSYKRRGDNFFKRIMKYCLDPLYIRKVRLFYGIGVGFKYDRLLLEKRFKTKNLNTFDLGYIYTIGKAKTFIESYHKHVIGERPLRIMIGHSGFAGLQHIKILEKLKRFNNENIKIVLVLSYGIEDYCNQVKTYARANFDEDKLEIIETMMPYNEYSRFLSDIDIAIFDIDGSAALGNITSLIYFGAKFFLQRDSFPDTVFSSENLEYYYVDELENMSFEQFSRPIKDQEKQRSAFAYMKEDDMYTPKTWLRLLDELKRQTVEN